MTAELESTVAAAFTVRIQASTEGKEAASSGGSKVETAVGLPLWPGDLGHQTKHFSGPHAVPPQDKNNSDLSAMENSWEARRRSWRWKRLFFFLRNL